SRSRWRSSPTNSASRASACARLRCALSRRFRRQSGTASRRWKPRRPRSRCPRIEQTTRGQQRSHAKGPPSVGGPPESKCRSFLTLVRPRGGSRGGCGTAGGCRRVLRQPSHCGAVILVPRRRLQRVFRRVDNGPPFVVVLGLELH